MTNNIDSNRWQKLSDEREQNIHANIEPVQLPNQGIHEYEAAPVMHRRKEEKIETNNKQQLIKREENKN